MKSTVFDVSGMSCGSCVRHVTEALRKLPAVQVGAVSVGSAEVSFDPQRTTSAAIVEAIAAAGYSARERGGGGPDRLACRAEPGQASGGGGGCCCG